MFGYPSNLRHVLSYSADLASPPEVIGPVPEGIRANFYVTGGYFNGPGLKGTLRPVGADWLTIRRDGVGVLDVRATLESNDGALIYLSYSGIADFGENGYEAFLEGNLPARVVLNVVPRFQTAHPEYAWLNRVQGLAVGEADLETFRVGYDVYRWENH